MFNLGVNIIVYGHTVEYFHVEGEVLLRETNNGGGGTLLESGPAPTVCLCRPNTGYNSNIITREFPLGVVMAAAAER